MKCNEDVFLCIETKNMPGNSLTKGLGTKRKLCSNRTGLDIWSENYLQTSTRGTTQILELSDHIQMPVEEPRKLPSTCPLTSRLANCVQRQNRM